MNVAGRAAQELAYQSERYGAGQRMRRQGLHPANLGMADDLPSRLAAEQLSTLAGMSQKVGSDRPAGKPGMHSLSVCWPCQSHVLSNSKGWGITRACLDYANAILPDAEGQRAVVS